MNELNEQQQLRLVCIALASIALIGAGGVSSVSSDNLLRRAEVIREYIKDDKRAPS